jgi:hypothetical protein
MTQITRDGKVLSQSRNLRGLLRYLPRDHARQVNVMRLPDGARLTVHFESGAVCETQFADYSVLRRWINARLHLGGVPLFVDAVSLGNLPVEMTR